MKEKIIFLIIGILVGAIISTCGFLIYNRFHPQINNQPQEMAPRDNMQNFGERPEMPDEAPNNMPNIDMPEDISKDTPENSNMSKSNRKGNNKSNSISDEAVSNTI